VARMAGAPAALALIAAPLALAAAAGPAAAQAPSPSPVELVRPWEDPEAHDIDDVDRVSRFWDHALHPERDRYEREIKRAVQLLATRRADAEEEAGSVLTSAITLEPDDPLGHFLRGHVHYLRREWSECAAEYAKVAALDADFEPPSREQGVNLAGLPALLDLALGQCLALSGDPLAAVTRMRRAIMRGGKAAELSADLQWHLGEALMALGRLHEAIAALRRGLELQGWRAGGRPREPLMLYALAAAYDRDEQLDQARQALSLLTSYDGGTTFNRPDLKVSPPEDIDYYKALVLETPLPMGDKLMAARGPEKSLVHYRQFLAQHGDGPWAARARSHIAQLLREPLTPARWRQNGTATVDDTQTVAAIRKVDDRLQHCVAEVPRALFEVKISQTIAAGRRPRNEPVRVLGGPRVQPGVGVGALLDFTDDPPRMFAAQQCLDEVARTIKLPTARGSAGEYVTVSFPVVWQGE